MKKHRIFVIMIILVGAIFIVNLAWSAGTAVVTPGYESHEADLIGARFRSFANTGGSELYLGVPDLGSGANRVEKNLTWQAENDISFTFDPQQDNLVVTVSNESFSETIEYSDLSANLVEKGFTYTVADLNVMQITLVNRDKAGTVTFANVALNGQSLGTFSETGWNDWMVSGVDFSQGFTLTGTIQISGTIGNSQEKSKVEIKVGHSSALVPTATPTNTPVPPTNTATAVPTDTPQPTATNTPEPVVTIIPGPAITNTPQPTAAPADSTNTGPFQIFLPLISNR